jgi:hypothetical protein
MSNSTKILSTVLEFFTLADAEGDGSVSSNRLSTGKQMHWETFADAMNGSLIAYTEEIIININFDSVKLIAVDAQSLARMILDRLVDGYP